jgi:hypothetical protein
MLKLKFILFILVTFSLGMSLTKTGIFGNVCDEVLVKDKGNDTNLVNGMYGSDYQKYAQSICLIVKKKENNVECFYEDWSTATNSPPYPYYGCYSRVSFLLKDYLSSNEFDRPVGTYQVDTTIPFLNERVSTASGGTGFCIGSRSIMTAAHLFRHADGTWTNPKDYVALFGYIKCDWRVNGVLNDISAWFDPYDEVRILGYDTLPNGTVMDTILGRDLCVLKTDRVMDGDIVPFTICTDSAVLRNALKTKRIFSMGHSELVPMSVSTNGSANLGVSYDSTVTIAVGSPSPPFPARISRNQYNHIILCNLEFTDGMSGAPVFIMDKKFNYQVIGVVTGGPDHYVRPQGTNWVMASHWQDTLYREGWTASWFTALEGVKYNRNCDAGDCPKINIQMKQTGPDKPTIAPVRGQKICVTLPTPFAPGSYVVRFSLGRTPAQTGYGEYSYPPVVKRVTRWNGQWSQPTVCAVVPDGLHYNVVMLNIRSEEKYDWHLYGTAYGPVLAEPTRVESALVDEGIDPSTFSFIARMDNNALPLNAIFIPYIPILAGGAKQPIVSWSWDFGDGKTSTEMFPSHLYTKAGKYSVSVTALTYAGVNLSYRLPDSIVAIGVVSGSLLNNPLVCNDNGPLTVIDLNTEGQEVAAQCTGLDSVSISGETTIKSGTEVTFRAR